MRGFVEMWFPRARPEVRERALEVIHIKIMEDEQKAATMGEMFALASAPFV